VKEQTAWQSQLKKKSSLNTLIAKNEFQRTQRLNVLLLSAYIHLHHCQADLEGHQPTLYL
jgi:hypothetical protein